MNDLKQFDYIIVGGGTAACILANRLSAIDTNQVVMLEAGGKPESIWIKIPAGFSKLLTNKKYNWRFTTQAEDNVQGRTIAIPRGRGLGGSSLINGMIYVRGQSQDYDHWEEIGATGWGWKNVAPYFAKLEQYLPGGAERGKKGPMHFSQVAERFELSSAFLKAAQEDGQKINADYNDADQEGFGYYQVAQKNGQRWSVYDGYLKPALSRRNLTVQTGAKVTKILVENGKAVGVIYQNEQGQAVELRARKEVILSAGTIQTPQILELSGIGNPELLAKYGIPVVHALPRVGENYIDHFATRMNWRIKNTLTINELAQGWRLWPAVMKYFLTRKGILTLGTGLVHGFVKTKPELATPDVQYFFMHASYANAAERKLDKLPGMTIGVTQLRPRSQGSIHIQSADPQVQPAIRPNFMVEGEDRQSLIDGMKIARRIVEQSAMRHFVDYEMTPGEKTKSEEDWEEFARKDAQTIYHPIGTCRMGTDPDAVVDTNLRLKGIDGLRVVDASVIPAMVSGNIQGAVMMVAEKAADLILENQ
jgi:choline dehydrogenase